MCHLALLVPDKNAVVIMIFKRVLRLIKIGTQRHQLYVIIFALNVEYSVLMSAMKFFRALFISSFRIKSISEYYTTCRFLNKI